ncbi:unnamed protein product [Caenorhabditis auriculariae]|uniref:Uncharacterized protein n=1 Tax=Caenorhabditis auriculariae TaxID=2777116 RepID=A0A8S1H1M8_9PELO|nr:unnamed protein product [Caenorhabditis auriculariae]
MSSSSSYSSPYSSYTSRYGSYTSSRDRDRSQKSTYSSSPSENERKYSSYTSKYSDYTPKSSTRSRKMEGERATPEADQHPREDTETPTEEIHEEIVVQTPDPEILQESDVEEFKNEGQESVEEEDVSNNAAEQEEAQESEPEPEQEPEQEEPPKEDAEESDVKGSKSVTPTSPSRNFSQLSSPEKRVQTPEMSNENRVPSPNFGGSKKAVNSSWPPKNGVEDEEQKMKELMIDTAAVPKKKVSDLIARFNSGAVESPVAKPPTNYKSEYGATGETGKVSKGQFN